MPALARAEGAVVRVAVAAAAAAGGAAVSGTRHVRRASASACSRRSASTSSGSAPRSGIDGTFNVCDFASKECIAVPHTEADLDVLTAGVSLPVFSPAVERDGRKLIDAVWIKDTNVAEALRRGAEELWLVWCIGNHGVYRDGAFQQYVHMIEIAANGALQEELALVRERGARLHVIRPRVPLPLDPDFFFGRVDASTLIAMGYRDAAAYLDAPHEDGRRARRRGHADGGPGAGRGLPRAPEGERPGRCGSAGRSTTWRRFIADPQRHGGRRRHPPGARHAPPRSVGALPASTAAR